MKSLLCSALLCSMTVMVNAAGDASVTGNWKIHNSIMGNESDLTCSLTQKEKDLTGTCKSDEGTSGNINGKVDDKNVNWTYKSEYNGGPITLVYSGKVNTAEKMSGTVKVEEYSVDGDFTATVSK